MPCDSTALGRPSKFSVDSLCPQYQKQLIAPTLLQKPMPPETAVTFHKTRSLHCIHPGTQWLWRWWDRPVQVTLHYEEAQRLYEWTHSPCPDGCPRDKQCIKEKHQLFLHPITWFMTKKILQIESVPLVLTFSLSWPTSGVMSQDKNLLTVKYHSYCNRIY